MRGACTHRDCRTVPRERGEILEVLAGGEEPLNETRVQPGTIPRSRRWNGQRIQEHA